MEGTCLVQLTNYGYKSHSIEFMETTTQAVDVRVYGGTSDSFVSLGSLYDAKYDVETYDDLYLLAVPFYGQDGSFSTYAQSTTYRTRGLPPGAIVGIVLGSLLCSFLAITCVCCIIKKKRNQMVRNQNLAMNLQDRQRIVGQPGYTQIPATQTNQVQYPNTRYVVEPSNPVPMRNVNAQPIYQNPVGTNGVNANVNYQRQIDQNIPLLQNTSNDNQLSYPTLPNTQNQ